MHGAFSSTIFTTHSCQLCHQGATFVYTHFEFVREKGMKPGGQERLANPICSIAARSETSCRTESGEQTNLRTKGEE